ncbi:hypothetical protein SAMN06265784_10523 [Paraburkholderia susongensis]|uniref:3-oxoacyl-[acyl-carrier protein] reductase n=1 Tax=Paraburkholderia susongensis TaxID=1515439 RepID=A0A1X7L4F4_9BURK|nr:hypothetical protein SAMN06265784_10523 [Paraburkholderia susongensis]
MPSRSRETAALIRNIDDASLFTQIHVWTFPLLFYEDNMTESGTKSIALDGREFNIVCSQINIGNALTELSERMTRGVRQANGTMAAEPMMDVKHVAEAVRYIANLPLSANVLNMTVMASNMPFVGRG